MEHRFIPYGFRQGALTALVAGGVAVAVILIIACGCAQWLGSDVQAYLAAVRPAIAA